MIKVVFLMEFLLVHSSIKSQLEIPHPLFWISQKPTASANTLIVPYESFDLNHSTLQTLFDNHRVPTLVDSNFGDLLLTGGNTLGVSIPTNTSQYIFVKIDQLSCINEREYTNVPHPY
jgi:hypothetical protein